MHKYRSSTKIKSFTSFVIIKYWKLWGSYPLCWIHSDVLSLKVVQRQSVTLVIAFHWQIFLTHLNLVAFVVTFKVSPCHWVSKVKFWHVTHQACAQFVLIDQVDVWNSSWLAKFKTSETCQVVSRVAFELWLEEILLIDEQLVVKSVSVIWLNWFFQVFQRSEVGNLSESEHIVVEKFHSACGPSNKIVDNDSDRLGINSSEVNGNDTVFLKVLWTVAVDVLVNEESVFDSDPSFSISGVLKVERLDFILFNEFQLKGVKSDWILTLIDGESSPLSGFVFQSLPSLWSQFFIFIQLIFEWQAWIIVIRRESGAAEEFTKLRDWGKVVNIKLGLGDIDGINVKIIALIFAFQLHTKFFQAVAFPIKERVSLFAFSTILTTVLDTTNWVREANEFVQKVSALACLADAVDVVVAVGVHLLALVVSVEEKAFSAWCADWDLVGFLCLRETVWFLEHAFANAWNKVFIGA